MITANIIEFSIRLNSIRFDSIRDNILTVFEIRSRDSIIIPLDDDTKFGQLLNISLRVPVEQGLLLGYNGLIVISLSDYLHLLHEL